MFYCSLLQSTAVYCSLLPSYYLTALYHFTALEYILVHSHTFAYIRIHSHTFVYILPISHPRLFPSFPRSLVPAVVGGALFGVPRTLLLHHPPVVRGGGGTPTEPIRPLRHLPMVRDICRIHVGSTRHWFQYRSYHAHGPRWCIGTCVGIVFLCEYKRVNTTSEYNDKSHAFVFGFQVPTRHPRRTARD